MRIHPIVAVLGLTAALAPTLLYAQPLAPGDRPLTVTVHMTTNYPLGPSDDEAALQRQAREAFYKTAAGECAVITEALKGACALTQVNINTRRMDNRAFGNQPSVPSMVADGTMSFAVTPLVTSDQ